MRPRLILAAAAACLVAAPAALAGAQAAITPTSIADAKVGLTHAAYKRILGKPVVVEYLENDYSRLVFTKRKIDVYFHGKVDAGVVVGTWNRAYRTAEGIGPCSTVKALKAAYGGRLVRVVVGGSFAGYRVGALVFSVVPADALPADAGRVHAVALKAASTPFFVASASGPGGPSCS